MVSSTQLLIKTAQCLGIRLMSGEYIITPTERLPNRKHNKRFKRVIKNPIILFKIEKLINNITQKNIINVSTTKISNTHFSSKKEDVIKVAEDCIEKGADVLEFRIDALDNPEP